MVCFLDLDRPKKQTWSSHTHHGPLHAKHTHTHIHTHIYIIYIHTYTHNQRTSTPNQTPPQAAGGFGGLSGVPTSSSSSALYAFQQQQLLQQQQALEAAEAAAANKSQPGKPAAGAAASSSSSSSSAAAAVGAGGGGGGGEGGVGPVGAGGGKEASVNFKRLVAAAATAKRAELPHLDRMPEEGDHVGGIEGDGGGGLKGGFGLVASQGVSCRRLFACAGWDTAPPAYARRAISCHHHRNYSPLSPFHLCVRVCVAATGGSQDIGDERVGAVDREEVL
jgi:hypothetical protein